MTDGTEVVSVRTVPRTPGSRELPCGTHPRQAWSDPVPAVPRGCTGGRRERPMGIDQQTTRTCHQRPGPVRSRETASCACLRQAQPCRRSGPCGARGRGRVGEVTRVLRLGTGQLGTGTRHRARSTYRVRARTTRCATSSAPSASRCGSLSRGATATPVGVRRIHGWTVGHATVRDDWTLGTRRRRERTIGTPTRTEPMQPCAEKQLAMTNEVRSWDRRLAGGTGGIAGLDLGLRTRTRLSPYDANHLDVTRMGWKGEQRQWEPGVVPAPGRAERASDEMVRCARATIGPRAWAIAIFQTTAQVSGSCDDVGQRTFALASVTERVAR